MLNMCIKVHVVVSLVCVLAIRLHVENYIVQLLIPVSKSVNFGQINCIVRSNCQPSE